MLFLNLKINQSKTMKYLSSIIAVLLVCTQLQAQESFFSHFEKYVDDERFTSVYVSPKMFEMVANLELDDIDDDIKSVISNLKGLQVLTTEVNSLKFYEEAKSKIPKNRYELLMKVRDDDENVLIYVDEADNIINELILLVGSPDEAVLLNITGKIDLDKISKIANSMDIEGLDNLKKVKGKEKGKHHED